MTSSSPYHSPLPGTLYNSARDMVGLGTTTEPTAATASLPPDMDWGVSSPNDGKPLRLHPFPQPSHISIQGSKEGQCPPTKLLLDSLVASARRTQSRDIRRRRACVKRKRVEQQLRQMAKVEIESERCISPQGQPED